MNRKHGIFPLILLALLALCGVVSPLLAQHTEYLEAPSRTYGINETGAMQSLGIEVQATPEISREGGISGFLIQLTYKDPAYSSSERVVFLQPTFLPSSCVPSTRPRSHGPFKWHNSRGVGFAVTLRQNCKDAHLEVPVPFLAASVWCSDLEKELRYIEVLASKRIFDFVATGYRQTVQTSAGRALVVGRAIWEGYELVSDILIVVDLVALTRGTLTAGKFIMKKIVGAVQDRAIEAVFGYLETELGSKVHFVHTGWDVTCRICGARFHLRDLQDGDRVRCSKAGCNAAAKVYFRTNP